MANLKRLINLSSGIDNTELANLGITGTGLGITSASLGIQNAEERMFKEVTDGSRRPYSIPSISTVNERSQSWWQIWNTGDAWTSYYNYLTGSQQADCERAFWFGLGTNTRQNTVGYNTQSMLQGIGKLDYATNSVMGGDSVHIAHNRNTSYSPFRSRVMFIRNFHPTTAKTITMWGHYTNYWSSGHDGSGVAIGTPNANGSYAGVTDISWSVPVNRTGGNSYYEWSFNVAIPAKTTVAVVQTNTMYYWQSGYVAWYLDSNVFYNLDSTFSDTWIQPDHKMTHVAHRWNDLNNEYNVKSSYRIWQTTATLFGDR